MIDTSLYGNLSILKDLEMLTNFKHVVALRLFVKRPSSDLKSNMATRFNAYGTCFPKDRSHSDG